MAYFSRKLCKLRTTNRYFSLDLRFAVFYLSWYFSIEVYCSPIHFSRLGSFSYDDLFIICIVFYFYVYFFSGFFWIVWMWYIKLFFFLKPECSPLRHPKFICYPWFYIFFLSSLYTWHSSRRDSRPSIISMKNRFTSGPQRCLSQSCFSCNFYFQKKLCPTTPSHIKSWTNSINPFSTISSSYHHYCPKANGK